MERSPTFVHMVKFAGGKLQLAALRHNHGGSGSLALNA